MKLAYIIIIISGILITLPFSYPGLFFISWFGLLPFIFMLEDSSPLEAFKKGTVLGIIIFFMTAGWIYYPLVNYSGIPWFFSLILYIVLFVLLGTIFGVWAWVLVIIQGNKIRPILIALSWVMMEFVRYKLLGGLPFAFMAYTQVNFLSLIRFAKYGSFLIISFVVILLNGLFYKLIKKKKLRFLIPIVIILVSIIIYGNLKINYYQNQNYQTIEAGIVNSNQEPEEKWAVTNIEDNMDYFIKETAKLQGIDLAIWPESSLTFDLIRNGYYRNMFMEKINTLNTYIQAGSIAIIDAENEIYNSSFLISPREGIINRYNKIRLVPFGEYMPMENIVKLLTGIEMVSEQAGEEIVLFSINSHSWKTAICSEILYPEFVYFNKDQAGFIVNKSNEAWYRKGNLQQQMWAAAIFRAVENRTSVVKAGNRAYSGLITPWGEGVVKIFSGEE
ncbi:MAG TPA: apolipoprotein N-acyltransferase, partial [Halanaerobiales bacterium]|nr:apolipoprotein N-acyltransferase [Halanaerobiales bacterium]